MKKLFFSTTILVLLAACTHGKNGQTAVTVTKMNALDAYPKQAMEATIVEIGDSLFYPWDIAIVDSVLVVETENKVGIFHIYCLETGQLLKKYGNNGRGGDEYLSTTPGTGNAGQIIVADKNQFDILDIKKLLQEEHYKPVRRKTPALFAVNFIALIDDQHIVFNSGSSENQLSFLDLNNDSLTHYNNYPEIKGLPQLTDFMRNTQVFHSSNACTNGKIAVAYSHYPIIDLIDMKNNSTKRLAFPFDNSFNKVTVLDKLNVDIDNSFYYYSDACATGKYLYLLYIGASEAAAEAMRVNVEVHKFDLDGNFVMRYLPNKLISEIAVTPDDKVCYGVAINEIGEDSIVKFSL